MITKRCVAAACLGLVVLSLATGCDRLPGKPKAAERWMAPGQVTDFTQLYAQNCAGCHGADGRLGAARPLHDPLYLALAGTDVVRQVIAHGVPGTAMPAFAEHDGGGLTDAQIDILVTGMHSRWGRPEAVQEVALPPYHLEAGDGQRGAVVYSTFCARCHGEGGRGGAQGGSIVDPNYLALVSDQHLRTTVITGRPDLGKPDWRADVPGQPMTPQDIADVVTWLAAQRQSLTAQASSTPQTTSVRQAH
jgi:cytochrome c oxidase cbb3-type subunit III